jgi:hypothetical protein
MAGNRTLWGRACCLCAALLDAKRVALSNLSIRLITSAFFSPAILALLY